MFGVYPATKHPTYFRSAGLPLEEPLVRQLRAAGLDRRDAPVFVQSFEAGNLLATRTRLGLRAPTVFLTSATGNPFVDPISYAEYLAPEGLRRLSRSVDGIGPDTSQIIPRQADGSLGRPTSLVRDPHAAGLTVHPYTFRAENMFLPTDLPISADPTAYGHAIDEQIIVLATGIDGLFTDQADIGVLSRALFLAGSRTQAAA